MSASNCQTESEGPYAPKDFSCRKPKLSIILLSSAVAGLQFLVLFALLGGRKFTLLSGSRSYSDIADSILKTGGFTSSYRPPLYPLLVAGTKYFALENWNQCLYTVQVLLALGSTALVYLLAAKVSRSPKIGLLAVMLCLTNLLLQAEFITQRETGLYIFLELLFFYLWFGRPQNLSTFISLGVVAGLAHLTRPNGIFLLAALVLVQVISKQAPLKSRSSATLAAVIAFFVTVTPWQIELHSLTGIWSLAPSTSNGLNLWKGNNSATDVIVPWIDVDQLDHKAKELVPDRDTTTANSDQALKTIAWEFIVNNPAKSVRSGLKKAAYFFAPFPVPLGTGEIQETEVGLRIENFKPRKGWLIFALQTCFVFCGVICFLIHWRRILDDRNKAFFIGVLSMTTISVAVHSLTFPETRLRLPLDVLFAICAAFGFSIQVSRRN